MIYMREELIKRHIRSVRDYYQGYITALMELLEEEAINLSEATEKLGEAINDIETEVLKVIASLNKKE